MKFTDILRQEGIPFIADGSHHHCTRGRIQLDCIFCSRGQQQYRMGYHLTKHYFHCFSCGHHSLASTLMALLDAPFGHVKEYIEELEGEKYESVSKPTGKLEIPKGVSPLLEYHKKYLLNRGFDPEHLSREWGIGGIGPRSSLAWRIWIPVTLGGEIVSWTARRASDGHSDGLRYLSARPDQEKIFHKTILYGADKAQHCVIIVEGPTDVWRVGRGAVATFGVSYTRAQLLALSKYPVRVVCYDSEAQAQRQARKLADQLEAFPGETYRVVLRGDDPGSASEREITKLRRRFL